MSKITAQLTVRVSPEVDHLRRELQEAMRLPANRVVEEALRRLKADLDRCRAPPRNQAAPQSWGREASR
jgi:hypothetical protein